MQAGKSSASVVGVNGAGFASAPWKSGTATVRNARVGKVCLYCLMQCTVCMLQQAVGVYCCCEFMLTPSFETVLMRFKQQPVLAVITKMSVLLSPKKIKTS